VATILDLVVVVLTVARLEKPQRRPNLIIALVALAAAVAPLTVNIIWSAVVTNG
jgi:hypothetical protein